MHDALELDWNTLRDLLAIAQTPSLAEAAKALRLDASTLSRRLATLEARHGTPLVRRGVAHPEARLTREGAALLPAIEAAARAVAAAAHALARSHPQTRTVRLTAPEELLSLSLVPALPSLQKRAPDVRLELVGAARVLDLRRGEADLALRLAKPTEPDVIAKKVGTLCYSVWRGASDTARPPRWLQLDAAVGPWPEREWTAQRLHGATPVLFATSPVALANAAAAGLGHAVLPDALAARDRRLRRVEANVGERHLWLVTPVALRRVPEIRAVAAWLTEVLAAGLRFRLGR